MGLKESLKQAKTLENMESLAKDQNDILEKIANNSENMAISLSLIADCIAQLMDFVSVVNFDELEARETELRTAKEKRL
jgi:hypothetical protein